MNTPSKWEDYLYLVELAYNNAFHKSLKMAPFESLYGYKCRTPMSWDNLDDRITIELGLLWDLEAQLKVIKEKLKEASERNKSLVDLKWNPREFKVSEKVLLRLKPNKSSIGSSKLAVIFVSPFSILHKVNLVAYKLELLANLVKNT